MTPSIKSDSNSSGSRSTNWEPTGHTIPDPKSYEERGRLYSAYRDGKYHLPNDGQEQDRLDLQHHLWLLMLDWKLGLAPLGEPDLKNVLDIGTGTGRWAKDFAYLHPNCNVIGTDISLIQHPDDTPPNCSFEREDSEDEWLFDKPFDYIHLRAMCAAFRDPKAMMETIFKGLRPGGWVEYQDFSFETLAADEASEIATQSHPTSLRQCIQRFLKGIQDLSGWSPKVSHMYKQWLIEVGFVDVVEKQILAPLNSWPMTHKDKQIGIYMAKDMTAGTDNMPRLLKASGLAEVEIDPYIAGVKEYIKDTSIHVYVPWYVVYGRKPLDAPWVPPQPPAAVSSYPDPEDVAMQDSGVSL